MATQKSRIFSFLLKFAESRPKDIAEALGIKPASVRRALWELRNIKAVSKPKKSGTASALKESEFYKETQKPIFRYVLDVVIYASSKQEVWRIITYSESKLKIKELMEEMIEEVEKDNSDRASEVRYEYGMEVDKVKSMPFDYPFMEVFKTRNQL